MDTQQLPKDLHALYSLSTCAVANAIEVFDLRLRNAGFMDATITCRFDRLPPVAGYAATARLRTSQPPMRGHRYVDRTDWWTHILSVPAPRVVVLEDVDTPPGVGALVGQVHASILRALGCVAIVTNGAVRDLDELARMGLQCFSHHTAVSHAYAHIFEFGVPVTIGGLHIQPKALLHGDRHGLIDVPLEILDRLPEVAADMTARDRQIVDFCGSADFTLDRLRDLIRTLGPRAADSAGDRHES